MTAESHFKFKLQAACTSSCPHYGNPQAIPEVPARLAGTSEASVFGAIGKSK
jgi:hypothetical protein